MGVEIFYSDVKEQAEDTCFWNADDNEPMGDGWYYWYCFPGCLPEGDPVGPFKHKDAAYRDAIDQGYYDFNGRNVSIEKAPACWASYLINGDSSGLDAKEIEACDAWVKWLDGGHVSDALGEPYFGRYASIGQNILDYIVITKED